LDWFACSGFSFCISFGTLWSLAVWHGHEDWFITLEHQIPAIAGLLVFILIGRYMMKSGVEKEEDTSESEHEIEERKDMIRS
jgi:putative Mn2+ efflux pump MntP